MKPEEKFNEFVGCTLGGYRTDLEECKEAVDSLVDRLDGLSKKEKRLFIKNDEHVVLTKEINQGKVLNIDEINNLAEEEE